MSSYEQGETVWVSNNQQVKIIKALDVGYTQNPNSDYIEESGDNQIEVYEVQTIRDSYDCNIGNREIMVSDNASCWLWGSLDYPDVAADHCEVLEEASIDPLDLIDKIESADLRDYVRDVVDNAKLIRDEIANDRQSRICYG